MKTFDKVRFAWTFRTYQQTVLDRASAHLRDGHIHIVAAPGSGKTILGLELVRRLGRPALILAPSVTIRRQWGERFAECFMPQGGREAEYVSEDLHTPQLLTCVTYQALHAAVQKTALKAENDPEAAESEDALDFTDFDVLEQIRACGIGTVCLDEAHYDSTPAEWDNYIRVCGEVDEEIFVPQLVAQKTLCPHQDYLYFNMPTDAETEVLRAHRAHAQTATKALLESGLLQKAQASVTEETANKDPQGAGALSRSDRYHRIGDYLMAQARGLREERAWILCLDAGYRFLQCRELCSGTVNAVNLPCRRVVEEALLNNASLVVLAHNHTSGNILPTLEDVEYTRSLMHALAMVDVKLLDHIILGASDFVSLRGCEVLEL